MLKFITTGVEMEAICHDSSLNRRRMNSTFDYVLMLLPTIVLQMP
jgi:hypothetical protein